jgi:DNA mismatch repair protein MutL
MSEYTHRITLSLAKMSAIVEGQILSQSEMEQLIGDLLKSTNPNLTPDGKTIIAILKQESISKMFA